MEKLKNDLQKEKQCLFKCSQCNKMIDLSGKIFYCKNCKSNYCEDCLKVHNEVFFDHEISKSNEDLVVPLNDESNNSLLANPDLDLDDRGFSDNNLPGFVHKEDDKVLSELNILFHETLTSIQEHFNEDICKIKARKNKEKKDDNDGNDNNENKIVENDLNININELKQLPPLKRLEKIMEKLH